MIAKDIAFLRTIYAPYLYQLASGSDVDREVIANFIAALTDINGRVGELECDANVRSRTVGDLVDQLAAPAADVGSASAMMAQAETAFAGVRASAKPSNVVNFPRPDRTPL